MLKYEGIVSKSSKFTQFFAKFEKITTTEPNMIFKYNFSTKKETTPKKNGQCGPEIGMVVVISVLSKNIRRFSKLHAFYPCLRPIVYVGYISNN